MLGFTVLISLALFWCKTKGGSQDGFYALGKRKAEFDTAVLGT